MTPTKSASVDLLPRCRTTGKKQYQTERDARQAAKSLRRDKGPKTKPYQCVYCQLWHIGHDRPPHRRRKRELGQIDW